jgi:hypothetical protein
MSSTRLFASPLFVGFAHPNPRLKGIPLIISNR